MSNGGGRLDDSYLALGWSGLKWGALPLATAREVLRGESVSDAPGQSRSLLRSKKALSSFWGAGRGTKHSRYDSAMLSGGWQSSQSTAMTEDSGPRRVRRAGMVSGTTAGSEQCSLAPVWGAEFGPGVWLPPSLLALLSSAGGHALPAIVPRFKNKGFLAWALQAEGRGHRQPRPEGHLAGKRGLTHPTIGVARGPRSAARSSSCQGRHELAGSGCSSPHQEPPAPWGQ